MLEQRQLELDVDSTDVAADVAQCIGIVERRIEHGALVAALVAVEMEFLTAQVDAGGRNADVDHLFEVPLLVARDLDFRSVYALDVLDPPR